MPWFESPWIYGVLGKIFHVVRTLLGLKQWSGLIRLSLREIVASWLVFHCCWFLLTQRRTSIQSFTKSISNGPRIREGHFICTPSHLSTDGGSCFTRVGPSRIIVQLKPLPPPLSYLMAVPFTESRSTRTRTKWSNLCHAVKHVAVQSKWSSQGNLEARIHLCY